jgi:predicted kinase
MNWIEKIDELSTDYLQPLRDCTHAYSVDKPNPWHVECDGNVFGHVMMVYDNAVKYYPDDEIIHLAALLHDIAKPFVKETDHESQKCKFYSHESIGVFLAIEILSKLGINETDTIRVLKLIQRHADCYKFSERNIRALYSQEDFDDVLKIRKCDMLGRESAASDDILRDVKTHNTSLEWVLESGAAATDINLDFTLCTLLIGPPASGKSTYISNLEKSVTVLSRDNCLMELATSKDYSEAWNEVDQKEVDKLFQQRLVAAIAAKEHFVVDMTNMTVKSRRKFTQDKRLSCNAVVFITPYHELITRNENRVGKTLKTFIIRDMCKRFQFPYELENFNDIKYII